MILVKIHYVDENDENQSFVTDLYEEITLDELKAKIPEWMDEWEIKYKTWSLDPNIMVALASTEE